MAPWVSVPGCRTRQAEPLLMSAHSKPAQPWPSQAGSGVRSVFLPERRQGCQLNSASNRCWAGSPTRSVNSSKDTRLAR